MCSSFGLEDRGTGGGCGGWDIMSTKAAEPIPHTPLKPSLALWEAGKQGNSSWCQWRMAWCYPVTSKAGGWFSGFDAGTSPWNHTWWKEQTSLRLIQRSSQEFQLLVGTQFGEICQFRRVFRKCVVLRGPCEESRIFALVRMSCI